MSAKKTIGFEEIDAKLDRVIDAMATKDKLHELDMKFSKKFQELVLMVDGLMKPLSELKMEYTGMMMQLARHERWIKSIADKTGTPLTN